MSAIDLSPFRLEAARNLGLTVDFRRQYGRDFTGSIADYARLSQEQQLRLAPEVGRLVRARPPAELTPTQEVMIDRLVKPPPVLPSSTAAFFSGALEGLQAIPATVGGAVQSATGGTLSNLLTKALLGAGLVVGGYLLFTRRR